MSRGAKNMGLLVDDAKDPPDATRCGLRGHLIPWSKARGARAGRSPGLTVSLKTPPQGSWVEEK